MVRKVNIVVGEPKSENDGSLVSCSESRQNGVHVQTVSLQNLWSNAPWHFERCRMARRSRQTAFERSRAHCHNDVVGPHFRKRCLILCWSRKLPCVDVHNRMYKDRPACVFTPPPPADTYTASGSLAVVLAMHIEPAWAVCSWTFRPTPIADLLKALARHSLKTRSRCRESFELELSSATHMLLRVAGHPFSRTKSLQDEGITTILVLLPVVVHGHIEELDKLFLVSPQSPVSLGFLLAHGVQLNATVQVPEAFTS